MKIRYDVKNDSLMSVREAGTPAVVWPELCSLQGPLLFTLCLVTFLNSIGAEFPSSSLPALAPSLWEGETAANALKGVCRVFDLTSLSLLSTSSSPMEKNSSRVKAKDVELFQISISFNVVVR